MGAVQLAKLVVPSSLVSSNLAVPGPRPEPWFRNVPLMGQPLASVQRALIDAFTRTNRAALAGLGVGVLAAAAEGVGVTTAGAAALGEVRAAAFGPPPAPEEMIRPSARRWWTITST